jgi:MFS family permease
VTRVRALIPDLPRPAWVLLGGDALSALGSGLTLAFFLVYLHEARGLELEVAGLALSAIAVAGLAGNPTGGSLSDRFGARNTLALGLVVAAAGSVAIAFVAEPWQALSAAAVLGFGLAVAWPAQDALLATVVTPEQRSAAFGLRHATMNAGLGLGALLAAGVVASDPSTRSFQLLYVLDAVSFLAFVPVLFLLTVPRAEREAASDGPRGGYRELLHDRTFLLVWVLTALLVTVGYSQYQAAFPAYAIGTGGLSARELGLVFAANTLAVVAGQLVMIKLLGGRRPQGLAIAAALFAASWAAVLLGGHLSVAAVFAVAMVVFGLGETAIAATVPALVNDLAPDRLRGRYNGAFTLAWTTGFAAGPLASGLALGAGAEDGLIAVFALGSVAVLLGALRLGRAAHVTRVVAVPAGAAS